MVVNLILYLVFSVQIFPSYSSNFCEIHKTCGECIRDSQFCKWCQKDDYKGTRCKALNSAFKDCPDKFIENPKSDMKIPFEGNQNYSSVPTKVVQIKPQAYKMRLRPGESLDFDISFKGADNYPADLYFLLDASSSMNEYKNNLANASKKIYDEMRKITNDVLLGMGTFIDKNAKPYLREKIKGNEVYSFRNQIKLTTDFETFRQAINNAPLGKNFDNPEAGLDALAQVLTCKEEIGWRTASRKIVIFITDELCHVAGDGRVAGIIQPYDGKCYTTNGIYTKELQMDYPSISMINKLANDEETTVIFAVPQRYLGFYENLENYIEGSKYINLEKIKFSQIEKILSDIYKEITHTIKFNVNMPSIKDRNNLKITFSPDCFIGHKQIPECIVNKDEEKHFKANVKLLDYYGQDHTTVNIVIEGIKEKLNLDIEIPACECEKNKSLLPSNSPYCSHQGTKVCGICECNSGRIGDRCGCTATLIEGDESSCKDESDLTSASCSGHGACFCGTCKCHPGYEGKYCECNKDSCPNKCNGHGSCVCGDCICQSGWSGSTCDCLNAPCKQVNGKTCSGRGECQCGKCKCHPFASWDARYEQAEDCKVKPCSDCRQKQCYLLQECAFCHHKQKDNEICDPICHGITINVTKHLENNIEDGSLLCHDMRVELGCYTQFKYRYDDMNYKIDLIVQTDSNCNESYYWYGGVSLLTLLVIGILTLLIWKVLTELRDRREYARFVKAHEGDCAGLRENPIYAPATTTFKNPAFRKPSVDYNLK